MTRSTKTLISITAVVASLAASAVPAIAADRQGRDLPSSALFSDADAIPSDRSLPSTALFSDSGSYVPSDDRLPSAALFSDSDALPAPDPADVVGTPVTTSADGFDWGDALIGTAVGVGLAALLGFAVGVNRRRTRHTVQPSV